jgi:N,N-dimethylformamidase
MPEDLHLTDFSVNVPDGAEDPHDLDEQPKTLDSPDDAGAGAARVDPEMRQIRMVPGGAGTIYSQQADGRLLWYRHAGWPTGTTDWAPGSSRLIGTDWHFLSTLVASADGQLFGFSGDGTVRWHKYAVSDQNTGAGTWAHNTSSVIGRNFDKFNYVFGGWDGVIYAEDTAGNLWWFKYLAGDGTKGPGAWANNGHGALINDNTWNNKTLTMRWADQNGVIYGVRNGGVLQWQRYLAGDGTNGAGAWANDGNPIDIGNGWDWGSGMERFSAGGVFYTVYIDKGRPAGPDHELRWYRLGNWDTVHLTSGANWVGQANLVGNGWTTSRTASLHGHADRWTVTTGDTINFAVSTTFPSFTATVLRLDGPLTQGKDEDVANSHIVWGPTKVNGRLQLVQNGYRTNGTGWQTDFSIPVPAAWKSGFHVARLTGPHNLHSYIPFAVRPATPTAKVAYMLPFLTHNAYNYWGGHNQYTWDNDFHNSPQVVTFRRPFANATIEPPGYIDARFYSDCLLMRWLANNNVAYDCYQDTDLQFDDSWLGQYKALVIGSHPEYWSLDMRTRVNDFVTSGGRLIYLGGNGIYERVDFSDDGNAAIHRNNPANPGPRWTYRSQNLPETDILGIAYDEAHGYMSFAPYEVMNEHPFLDGTGLKTGDQFGATGYNIAASGWEIDRPLQGPTAGLTVIARGAQGDESGAHMTHWDRGNGGWVFGVGSISFNGSLTDPGITAILRNVFTAAQA